jgi:kynurenine formamidase
MTEPDRKPNAPINKTITYSRVVDLSHQIHPGIPQWPGDPPVEFHETARLDGDGYYLRRFSMGEHSATHMNAPIAFQPEGRSIDAYSAESLTVPAVVIDVTNRCSGNPDYALSSAELLAWEGSHDSIPMGSVVLLHTGWHRRWSDSAAYLGSGPNNETRFPGFSYEAAHILISQRGVNGLGTDTPGLEPGSDTGFTVNKLVLEQPRIALENLANLDQLPPIGITLVIGILRLQGGSGSPVSVTAFVE